MQPLPSTQDDDPIDARAASRTTDPDPLHALLHRWLVQYNPAYLASAAFVLGGLTLVSREASESVSGLGRFGVAAVAELYAFTLIAGAALLVRIDRRRPAVMLALLAVLYQGDLTLHVETSAYLGDAGLVAALVWVVLFVAKLYALAAALQLRPSRSAIVVPALAALGLALLPRLLRELVVEDRTTLVALFVFAIGAAALWTRRDVESAIGFDVRGRRAIRFTWFAWAALGLAHVAYWGSEHRIALTGLLPVAALLATRHATERHVWIISGATLCAVAIVSPTSLSSTALMVAVVLSLHALRRPARRPSCATSAVQPYRELEPPPPVIFMQTFFEPAPTASRVRLLLGAGSSLYLAVWTLGWAGAAWPEHRVVLDLVLALACVLAAWRLRRPLLVIPAIATYAHLAAHEEWITPPGGSAQWGAAAITIGFALLVGPLLASWRVHRRARGC